MFKQKRDPAPDKPRIEPADAVQQARSRARRRLIGAVVLLVPRARRAQSAGRVVRAALRAHADPGPALRGRPPAAAPPDRPSNPPRDVARPVRSGPYARRPTGLSGRCSSCPAMVRPLLVNGPGHATRAIHQSG